MADPIVIIGAGLSGLAAALEIEAAGEEAVILEAADHVGGKLETTLFDDAYRLDRGFQVLLPAYPELQRVKSLLDDLELKSFNSGARLEMSDGPILIANPVTHPEHLLSTALGTYANVRDKFLVMKLQFELLQGEPDELLRSVTGSTRDYLQAYGFSENFVETFWMPFFCGIFLERELITAAGFFRYLMRMFASSAVAVPKLGIGELPKQMVRRLRKSEVRLSAAVRTIHGQTLELASGQKINARAIIAGTMGDTSSDATGPFGTVTSFWFSAPEAPFEGPWLSLNSLVPVESRLLNHVAVLSNVSRDYALKGDALICVSAICRRDQIDFEALLRQAERLYGGSVRAWQLLRTDEIKRPFRLYLDRMDLDTPSQQGAIASGRRHAIAALARL